MHLMLRSSTTIEDAMATKQRLLELIHPGEVLFEEFMKPMGISINQLARDLVVRNPNVTELRRICKERGMVTLREDGLLKVNAGLTTVEEVFSATESAM